MIPIVVLAAGASSRMAPLDKLTEPVNGQPLLARVAGRALATGAPVVVVLAPDRPARAAAVEGLDVVPVVAPDAALGMAASLRAGIAAVAGRWPGAQGVMILPGDMPGPEAEDLSRLLAVFAEDPARIVRGATGQGIPGHPVIFPAALFPALMAQTGDEGGRAVVAAHRDRVVLVPLPGDRAVLDLDTPEDWAAFRAR